MSFRGVKVRYPVAILLRIFSYLPFLFNFLFFFFLNATRDKIIKLRESLSFNIISKGLLHLLFHTVTYLLIYIFFSFHFFLQYFFQCLFSAFLHLFICAYICTYCHWITTQTLLHEHFFTTGVSVIVSRAKKRQYRVCTFFSSFYLFLLFFVSPIFFHHSFNISPFSSSSILSSPSAIQRFTLDVLVIAPLHDNPFSRYVHRCSELQFYPPPLIPHPALPSG